MAKSNFIVRGGADFSGITREMDKTEKQFKGFEGKINKAFGGIAGGMGLNIGKLGKFALIGMAVKGLYNFSKASIQVASDLKEVQNVVDVTFGGMSAQVNAFADNSIKQFGLSELSAKRYSSTMGAMLKSSGIAGQTATDMSIDLAKLSADMASFYNLQNDVAFDKIMSGMSGMTQPLKELGINMNIANLENYALSQGIRKSWQEMNQAEQTMLRYNYLLNVTGDAQGDFARNSGSWANQIKILKEQWQEFMGLIGKALMEVLLPVVKVLNGLLGILIKVVKEFGKMYTLITGKEAAVETNNNISDTAFDAAEGEDKLADGIGKAAKAAKKALAPFDELNILQSNLAGGGSGGLAGAISSGGLNTTMSTKQVDDGIKLKIDYEEPNKFFVWFNDKWARQKQMVSSPLLIPAPVFAAIPNPIYKPNWNLTPPFVPAPNFGEIKNPVYEPNWNLKYPVLQPLVIPALNLLQYNLSLENMKENFAKTKTKLEGLQAELLKKLDEESSRISKKIETGLSTSWGIIEGNYNKHKENVGIIATGISTVLVANINQGLSKLGVNTTNTITTVQNNLNTFGKNVGAIAAETAKSWANNLSEGFRTTSQNVVNFANTAGENIKSFGEGMLRVGAETAQGFASNIASGLTTAWNNFKEFASATGEKVSGWFSANKKVITTTAIVAGVAVGAGALALAAPALIPYAGAALGGLASIPALAKGAVIPPNSEFLAVLGDQRSGTNIETPERLLRQIMREEFGSDSGNNNGGDTTIIVNIGEDTITEKVVSNINRRNRISGKTVIQV